MPEKTYCKNCLYITVKSSPTCDVDGQLCKTKNEKMQCPDFRDKYKESKPMDYIDIIDEIFKHRHELDEEFNAKCKDHGSASTFEDYSFWPELQGKGIIRIRKYKNGKYDRHSWQFISEAEIEAMNKAMDEAKKHK